MFVIVALLLGCLSSRSFGQNLRAYNYSTVHRQLTLDDLYANYPKDHVDKFLESRRKLEEAVATPVIEAAKFTTHHSNPWMEMKDIDGLKISEVATFITTTTTHDEAYLWERIIPSARTWMKFLEHKFVILEDNFLIRFSLRHCKTRETKSFTVFFCPHEPAYILSRKCNNDYYGHAGPCCKVDEVIHYLVNETPELFAQIKWFFHGDDDTYFRVDQLMRWMAAVDNSGVGHLPIVANNARVPGANIWHIEDCKEITACGWMQPMVLNHAALERMKVSSANYGLMDTCKAFEVTHDIGFEAYVWLFELYHIQIPRVEINGEHKGKAIFQPDLVVVHYLKHEGPDDCEKGTKWPDSAKYNQHIVVGCGDVDSPGPLHDPSKHWADMYDGYEYFRDHGKHVDVKQTFQDMDVVFDPKSTPNDKPRKIIRIIEKGDKVVDGKIDGLPVEKAHIPYIYLVKGYKQTKHGKTYDLQKEWHPFTMKDCSPPGWIKH